MYRGAHGNKERNLLKLGEISPRSLSKLCSKLGSIERVFGLSNAERIGNLKVYLWTKNPHALIAGECQTLVKYQKSQWK